MQTTVTDHSRVGQATTSASIDDAPLVVLQLVQALLQTVGDVLLLLLQRVLEIHLLLQDLQISEASR
jgi:hypothetical protein